MSKINEATDTDLKVIDALHKIGWKRGDTLLYQQEYKVLPEQRIQFEGRKSVKNEVNQLFDNRFANIFNELQMNFKI